MAKRKAQRRNLASSSGRKRTSTRAAAQRRGAKRGPSRPPVRVKKAPRTLKGRRLRSGARKTEAAVKLSLRKAKRRQTTKSVGRAPRKNEGTRTRPSGAARLNRARRTLDETVQTPPSSLNMDRRGSAVRTARAELAQSFHEHKGMSAAIAGGDVDVDVQDAYFTGDEAPGGDNPAPDQEVVDDIGKALGVEYQDNEELKAVDKVAERDRKRWELDPASSEDYKDRK